MKDVVTFHIITKDGEFELVNDTTCEHSLGKFVLDGVSVRKMLDEWCRGLIEERFKMLGLDKTIDEAIGRRLDIAIKAGADAIAREVPGMVKEAAAKKIRAHIDTLPIRVQIEAGTPAEEGWQPIAALDAGRGGNNA